jgi:hypothetical protein
MSLQFTLCKQVVNDLLKVFKQKFLTGKGPVKKKVLSLKLIKP